MNDLPSPKQDRRKRAALRLAAIVVAVSALGAGYLFTRPPELVWWTSPQIWGLNTHVRIMAPRGWEIDPKRSNPFVNNADGWYGPGFVLHPVDGRPRLVQVLLRQPVERAELYVGIGRCSSNAFYEGILRHDAPSFCQVTRRVPAPTGKQLAEMHYIRENRAAFNRTYRQICDSLTIE